ncbi:MAG: septation protein IspZ, partial [Sphingopyxis sp.]
MTENAPTPPAGKPPAWLPILIDFGPLLVFFITFRLSKGAGPLGATSGAINGTMAFMVAITIALVLSKWLLKKISPMLWLSAISGDPPQPVAAVAVDGLVRSHPRERSMHP